jgi:3-oxoadipate enol-lactonase
MPMIDIDGAAFNVRVEGPDEAPPLIFSNSLASSLSMWDDQAAALAKRFRVVRYDQRGHGKSAAPEGPYSIERLGRDVLAIMDRLGIGKADWCGLSMGGFTGMWLLTHARERIGRAVLANTAAKVGTPEIWAERIRLARDKGMAAVAEATLERWFTKRFIAKAPDTVARIRDMIVATPVAGYAGCAAAIRDMDQREAIRAITSPTLIIIGAEDPGTTPEMGEFLHRQIKGSQAVTLDAAHLSNIEQAKAFTKAVADFLK